MNCEGNTANIPQTHLQNVCIGYSVQYFTRSNLIGQTWKRDGFRLFFLSKIDNSIRYRTVERINSDLFTSNERVSFV